MRYNANELKEMAVRSGKNCSKEGVLKLMEKEGKLWNKTDVLTERWCRLVDNLFFYFKTRDANSEPHGVFVLEGSRVKPVQSDGSQGCAFILEFDGDNRSTYFQAREPKEAQEWIKVLEDASYTKLKQKYELLMKKPEIVGKTTDDSSVPQGPSLTVKPRETRSANSSPMLRRKKVSPTDYNMTLSDFDGVNDERAAKKKQKKKEKTKNLLPSDSTAPILEVALSCLDLNIPKAIDHKRVVQIKVLSLVSPATEYKEIFRTECIKASTSVQFLLTLGFYQSHLVLPHTQLQFHLCQHKENNTVSPLGYAACTVSEFFSLNAPLKLSLRLRDNSIGILQFSVLREHLSSQLTKSSNEGQLSSVLISTGCASGNIISSSVDQSYGDIGRIQSLKSLYCEAISRTYKFHTEKDEFVSVQEIMLETRLSFHIPQLYLKLLVDQETRTIVNLESLKSLCDRLQISRTKHVEYRKRLLRDYQEAIRNVVTKSKNASFKASVQKTEKDLEFVPTNLHLQRMRVQHSDCISAMSVDSRCSGCSTVHSTGIHDIITVGAGTAHCMKYKHGGLVSLIPHAAERLKRGDLHSLLRQDDVSREISELPATLPDLYKDSSSIISALKTMFLSGQELNAVPMRMPVETCLTELSDKICKMVSILDNKQLCDSIHILFNQSNQTASNLVGAATSLFTPSGVEWEEMKSSVKTKLAQILRSIHTMLDAADDLLSLQQQESPPPTFDDVLSDLHELSSRLASVMNTAMQGHAVHIMQTAQESSDLVYRKDVVFSQVLSTCICGVATTLVSSLHNSVYLENCAKYGMLIQFESLLSTYKNELGMLEDYIIGAYDLHKVSFCCERAPEQDGPNMDHLLPSLHGTRNKIIVKLHLDPISYSMLPDSLKKGQTFKVVPVFFNVGINEEQTLAEKIGKSSLQDYVNSESLTHLSAYCKNVAKSSDSDVESRLRRLNDAIASKKTKNVEILHLSAEICRSVNGVRVTSCKSAKDRTAMAVTLEQVQVLLKDHGLAFNVFNNALNCMRSEGTRRENTRKNVGEPKYAFTSVQLMTFPKQYKPPDGTYGNIQS